ncbi:MAG: hydroxyacid dehydrogenase, partial [Desulfuromonadales bacterium]|nr:hydroxyacid dehydrogenase [Desulfuromonadales bacterium]
MKNVLITTSSFNAELITTIKSSGLTPVLNPYKRKLTEEEVDDLIQEFRPVGMIAGVEPLTRTVLEKAPFLKVISRCGIGMDSVDLDTAAGQEITVTNTPDAPTIP